MNDQFERDVREHIGWTHEKWSNIECHLTTLNGQVAAAVVASQRHEREIIWLRNRFWLLIPTAGVLVAIGLALGKFVF